MTSHLTLIAVLVLNVYAQLIIKARVPANTTATSNGSDRLQYVFSMFTDLGVITGFGAILVAAALWMTVIDRMDLGYAYPFLALSFALVPLSAFVALGEPLPPLQLFGIALIILGVAISAIARH